MKTLNGSAPKEKLNKSDLIQIRAILTLAFIAQFLWGLFPQIFAPTGGLVPYHHLVSAICFLGMIISWFVRVNYTQPEILKFSIGSIMTAHSVYAASINLFDFSEIISTVVTMLIVSNILQSKRMLYFYLGFGSALLTLFLFTINKIPTPQLFVSCGLFY